MAGKFTAGYIFTKFWWKYNHFICHIVYAYVWRAFLIACVVCSVALSILLKNKLNSFHGLTSGLLQLCLYFYCNITEMFHCAWALRLDFSVSWLQGFSFTLSWNKGDSCSVQCFCKLLLSSSPVASTCVCWGLVIASNMFDVSRVFHFVFFAWRFVCFSLRLWALQLK